MFSSRVSLRISAFMLLALSPACLQLSAGSTEDIASKAHKSHCHKQVHVPEVKQSVLINASPQHVWAAIQHQRSNDNHRKLLSYDGTAATLHETFASLPIVGEASCVYVENESTPMERIDYNLLKSDRFAVFQGAWVLSPGKMPNSTMVELSNAIDPGIRVPFWQDITKMAANRLVKHRLEAVTAYAEELEKHDTHLIR